MFYLIIIASITIIAIGIWLSYGLKREKPVYSPFRKKRVHRANRQRRRRTLLDPDRGKVIPFPIPAASPQGDGSSDSQGTENK